MSRTVLAVGVAVAVLIGLAACSGGKQQSTKSAAGSKAAAQPTSEQKKKTTAKPDTAKAKNPLTNN